MPERPAKIVYFPKPTARCPHGVERVEVRKMNVRWTELRCNACLQKEAADHPDKARP